jgi:hypothetical protein
VAGSKSYGTMICNCKCWTFDTAPNLLNNFARHSRSANLIFYSTKQTRIRDKIVNPSWLKRPGGINLCWAPVNSSFINYPLVQRKHDVHMVSRIHHVHWLRYQMSRNALLTHVCTCDHLYTCSMYHIADGFALRRHLPVLSLRPLL